MIRLAASTSHVNICFPNENPDQQPKLVLQYVFHSQRRLEPISLLRALKGNPNIRVKKLTTENAVPAAPCS